MKTGSLSATTEVIGRSGLGTFTQNGGTNTVTQNLELGVFDLGIGTYNLSNTGSLSVQGNKTIGVEGTGTFNQTGGTNSVGQDLILGRAFGGSGTYNLSGTGSLSVGHDLFVGDEGAGTFTQSGGTNSVPHNLFLANQAGSSGTYNLSGGSLSAKFAIIGNEGTANFNQDGGTHSVTNDLYLGRRAGSSATYHLSNGDLSVADDEYIGGGDSTFTQTGGSHTVTSDLILGPGVTTNGTYELSAGELSAANEFIGSAGTGNFTQTGGTNSVTHSLVLAHRAGSSGTYNLEDGMLSAGTIEVNPGGIFNQTGGSWQGIFNLNGGTLTGTLMNQASSTFNLNSGTLAADMINQGTANFNIDFTLGSSGSFTQESGSINATNLFLAGECNFLGGNLSANSLQVNPGGTFRGLGTLSAAFTNSGLMKPGTSVGPLDIVGSFTQDPSGTLEIEIEAPTSFDRLNVTGTPGIATLNGTLSPLLPVVWGVFRPSAKMVFRDVITATGGVSCTFITIAHRQITPILFWQPIYNPNSVDLKVVRDHTNAGLGLCPNQWQVGNMLNRVAATATGDLANVLNAIDFLPTAGAVREAYKEISPEKAAPLPELGFAAAGLQQRSLARRITDLRFGARAMNFARGFPGSLNLLGSRGAGGIMLAYNGASLVGMIPAQKETASENRWGVFLDPAVILGNRGSTVNQTGYDYTLAGFTLGVDCRVRPNFLVGLATGYSHTYAKFRGSGGSVTNHTWPLTAYAAYLPENGYAFASLGYALNLFDLERHISFGGLSRTAKSSTSGHQFNAYGEAGYDFKMKPVVITPAVSLAYTHIAVDGFTEKNAGALNLKVDSQCADSLQTGVGVKVAAPFKKDSTKVVPQAYAFYQHEFSNNSRGLDARLSQGSSTMAFTTDEPQRDFAVVGGNVTLFINKKLSAMVNYNAEVGRGNSTVHSISAGLRWEF